MAFIGYLGRDNMTDKQLLLLILLGASVLVIVGFLYWMISSYLPNFNLWTGLDVRYCDNLCELGRMGRGIQ